MLVQIDVSDSITSFWGNKTIKEEVLLEGGSANNYLCDLVYGSPWEWQEGNPIYRDVCVYVCVSVYMCACTCIQQDPSYEINICTYMYIWYIGWTYMLSIHLSSLCVYIYIYISVCLPVYLSIHHLYPSSIWLGSTIHSFCYHGEPWGPGKLYLWLGSMPY